MSWRSSSGSRNTDCWEGLGNPLIIGYYPSQVRISGIIPVSTVSIYMKFSLHTAGGIRSCNQNQPNLHWSIHQISRMLRDFIGISPSSQQFLQSKKAFGFWSSRKSVRFNNTIRNKNYGDDTSCWWKKSYTTWDVQNPVNNGIFTISTG